MDNQSSSANKYEECLNSMRESIQLLPIKLDALIKGEINLINFLSVVKDCEEKAELAYQAAIRSPEILNLDLTTVFQTLRICERFNETFKAATPSFFNSGKNFQHLTDISEGLKTWVFAAKYLHL